MVQMRHVRDKTSFSRAFGVSLRQGQIVKSASIADLNPEKGEMSSSMIVLFKRKPIYSVYLQRNYFLSLLHKTFIMLSQFWSMSFYLTFSEYQTIVSLSLINYVIK